MVVGIPENDDNLHSPDDHSNKLVNTETSRRVICKMPSLESSLAKSILTNFTPMSVAVAMLSPIVKCM